MLSHLDRSGVLSRMRELARGDAMPQSLLLIGPEGSGKEACALELARVAICEDAGLDGAAGRKVRALSHPDLYYTCPVERSLTREGYRALLDAKAAEPLARVKQPSSAVLPIGDRDDPGLVSVRAIRRFVQAPPFEGRRKVIVIGDAHRMNRQAANALLKTLEEPPPKVLILLCTHQPHLLPATIPSRCAKLAVPPFSEEELASHLREVHSVDAVDAARLAAASGGNARRALDLIDDQSREIANWAGHVLGRLVADEGGAVCAASEKISKGQSPTGGAKKKSRSKSSGDSSLSASRDIGMRMLDFLIADFVLLHRIEAGVDVTAALRESLPDPSHLPQARWAAAVQRLGRAREDLSRNLNVGLVLMHALLETRDLLHPARAQAARS